MAHEERDQKTSRTTTTEVRPQDKPSRDAGRMAESRRESGLRHWPDPFDVLRRFTDRLDRWPFGPQTALETAARRRGLAGLWTPQIESFQRDDQFVVRADLPGLNREDVHVEIEDDAVVISGERSSEEEHEDDGFYSSERSYGRFCRVVPLPDGAIADTAKAKFERGVLEVTIQAPPREVRRGRKVEISGEERGGR